MSFLPTGYEAPKTGGNYMKFMKGTNRFRVLSNAIVGYEYWLDEGNQRKPVRVREFDEIPQGHTKDAKHFWAFTVYNYQEEKVQILEITQKSIMSAIEVLVKDEDWGDPKGYDIVVTRTGDGLETEYQVNPKPHSDIDVEAPTVDLTKLFTGEDPFSSGTTKNVAQGSVAPQKEKTIDFALEGKRKMYFVIAKQAGYESEKAKDMIKTAYKKESFNDLSAEELKKMTEWMNNKIKKSKEADVPEVDFDKILGNTTDLDDVISQDL
jgi:hypothetical protein